MAPLQIRLVEVDARPDARADAVYSAALGMALRWQCNVRVRSKTSSFLILARDALTAAELLAQRGVEPDPASSPAGNDG